MFVVLNDVSGADGSCLAVRFNILCGAFQHSLWCELAMLTGQVSELFVCLLSVDICPWDLANTTRSFIHKSLMQLATNDALLFMERR